MFSKNSLLFAGILVFIGGAFAFSIKYLTPDIDLLKKNPNLFSGAILGASLAGAFFILLVSYIKKRFKLKSQNKLLTGSRI